MVTRDRLMRLLDYDKETGKWTWRVGRGVAIKAGTEAGYCDLRGYRRIRIGSRQYRAHRLAWLYVHGYWPSDEIDHINHVPDDNRLLNLRDVAHRENGKNHRRRRDTKHVTGISWDEERSKWRAYINVDSKKRFFGSFGHVQKAIAVRRAAEYVFGYHQNHGR